MSAEKKLLTAPSLLEVKHLIKTKIDKIKESYDKDIIELHKNGKDL